MPDDDIFEASREARREKLRAAGWLQEDAAYRTPGYPWTSPSGCVYTEEEAFAWLDRLEKSHGQSRSNGGVMDVTQQPLHCDCGNGGDEELDCWCCGRTRCEYCVSEEEIESQCCRECAAEDGSD